MTNRALLVFSLLCAACHGSHDDAPAAAPDDAGLDASSADTATGIAWPPPTDGGNVVDDDAHADEAGTPPKPEPLDAAATEHMVFCGGEPCAAASHHCCIAAAPICTPVDAGCAGDDAGAGADLACDGPEDCASGESCCVQPLPHGLTTRCAADCTADGGMRGTACHNATQCTTGSCCGQPDGPFGVCTDQCGM